MNINRSPNSGLNNARYLHALLRQPIDRTPVWLMRQAGRYLPEYRALRAQAGDFMSLLRDPDMACEAALQPLRRFALDAAILFSDILTIPDAMGLGLYFTPGEGPCFKRPLRCQADINKLPILDPEMSLGYVMETVRRLRRSLMNSIPLIGFSGSPWTLAAYMVEGVGRGAGNTGSTFSAIQNMMLAEPAILRLLLDKLADNVVLYLNAQIRAGVHAVMIFDTWGGILGDRYYQSFSLDYIHKIVDGLIREQHLQRIPVTIFTKGSGNWLEAMANTGCDALGLDCTIDLSDARRRVGNRVALQGNLNPTLLFQPAADIQYAVEQLLASYGGGTGHVFNLGHGIPPDASPEQVQVVIQAVHHAGVHDGSVGADSNISITLAKDPTQFLH